MNKNIPHDFADLLPFITLMKDFNAPWCFGGGWAINGFIGHMTRPHDDVDIVIWRDDHLHLQSYFADWEWHYHIIRDPRPWPKGQFLDLPVHNAHARHKTNHLEMLMLERDNDQWWFRRNREIQMPADRVIIPTPLGFHVLNPAIALLFKSNRLDTKDQHDFNHAYPQLSGADRQWLLKALIITNSDHPWIAQVQSMTKPPSPL